LNGIFTLGALFAG